MEQSDASALMGLYWVCLFVWRSLARWRLRREQRGKYLWAESREHLRAHPGDARYTCRPTGDDRVLYGVRKVAPHSARIAQGKGGLTH